MKFVYQVLPAHSSQFIDDISRSSGLYQNKKWRCAYKKYNLTNEEIVFISSGNYTVEGKTIITYIEGEKYVRYTVSHLVAIMQN